MFRTVVLLTIRSACWSCRSHLKKKKGRIKLRSISPFKAKPSHPSSHFPRTRWDAGDDSRDPASIPPTNPPPAGGLFPLGFPQLAAHAHSESRRSVARWLARSSSRGPSRQSMLEGRATVVFSVLRCWWMKKRSDSAGIWLVIDLEIRVYIEWPPRGWSW